LIFFTCYSDDGPAPIERHPLPPGSLDDAPDDFIADVADLVLAIRNGKSWIRGDDTLCRAALYLDRAGTVDLEYDRGSDSYFLHRKSPAGGGAHE
jgi:hypothetical protein